MGSEADRASQPEIVSATPVFVGTTPAGASRLDYLNGGETIEEFLRFSERIPRTGNRLSGSVAGR